MNVIADGQQDVEPFPLTHKGIPTGFLPLTPGLDLGCSLQQNFLEWLHCPQVAVVSAGALVVQASRGGSSFLKLLGKSWESLSSLLRQVTQPLCSGHVPVEEGRCPRPTGHAPQDLQISHWETLSLSALCAWSDSSFAPF